MEPAQSPGLGFKGPSSRACGCKGIRCCFVCKPSLLSENESRENCLIQKIADGDQWVSQKTYDYCLHCRQALLFAHNSEEKSIINDTECIERGCESELKYMYNESHTKCDHVESLNINFPGINIFPDFVSEKEEEELEKAISDVVFVNSQSGRRKQDFGPKVNFKRQKLKIANFSGLPCYSEFLYRRMTSFPVLADFCPVEMCNLEYMDDRGAHIDPHFDDFWLWGERLVTVNLLSDSTLTFTMDSLPNVFVRVPMPRRSLIVVSGSARYKWKHCILRKDIKKRRIAMTFRELSAEFQEGGARHEEGQGLLELSLTFKGLAIGS